MVDTQVERILSENHYGQPKWVPLTSDLYSYTNAVFYTGIIFGKHPLKKQAGRSGDVDTYLDDLIAKASPQWEGVDADEFMGMARGREPGTITEHLASVSEDWAAVLNDNGGWDHLVKVNKPKENA